MSVFGLKILHDGAPDSCACAQKIRKEIEACGGAGGRFQVLTAADNTFCCLVYSCYFIFALIFGMLVCRGHVYKSASKSLAILKQGCHIAHLFANMTLNIPPLPTSGH
ncbi:unnamed protein product [Pylaiella littoralis]